MCLAPTAMEVHFLFLSLNRSCSSRLWTLKELAPQRFCDSDGEASHGVRKIYCDPEFLTLHKLLAFLHAAVILNGELISSSDIIR